jgi:hypothetical protein
MRSRFAAIVEFMPSAVLGVGRSPRQDEDSLAAVGGAGFGCGYNTPFRIETEAGQRPENGSDCPNKSPFMPLASSHCPLPQSHDARGSRLNAPDTSHIPL